VREAGPTSVKVVADYLERACNIGHGEACALASSVYRGVEGVAADSARADDFRQRGCRLGVASMCAELVDVGQQLPLPSERARTMRDRLCRGGVASACR
jgi:hypothetical protein